MVIISKFEHGGCDDGMIMASIDNALTLDGWIMNWINYSNDSFFLYLLNQSINVMVNTCDGIRLSVRSLLNESSSEH